MTQLLSKNEFLKKYRIKDSDFQATNLNWDELNRIYVDHTNNIPFLESQLSILFSIFVKIPNVHSVRYRVKDAEHLIAKIIRKKIDDQDRNITFDTYISELDDIIGLRVLHLFKDEWKNVHDYILENYNLKESPTAYYREGDSNEYLEEYTQHECVAKPHKYGYRSIHYVIQQKILATTIGCEVQVRTVFEEAWSEIDHTIRYPYDMDNEIFKQYLMIVNRLAGSADEMGTFVVHLKEHLAKLAYESQQEIDNKNDLIDELKKEISDLKVSKKMQESINNKIDKLTIKLPNTDLWNRLYTIRSTTEPIKALSNNSLLDSISTFKKATKGVDYTTLFNQFLTMNERINSLNLIKTDFSNDKLNFMKEVKIKKENI